MISLEHYAGVNNILQYLWKFKWILGDLIGLSWVKIIKIQIFAFFDEPRVYLLTLQVSRSKAIFKQFTF